LPDRETVTRAIILRRVAYGERDWILTLLTRDHGIVSAIARAARSSRRRFGSSLDLFVVFEACLCSRHPSRLPDLTAVDPQIQFSGILENLDRLEMGQATLMLAHDLLRDAPATPPAFDQVVSCLTRLEQSEEGCGHGPLLWLGWQLLADLGATIHEESIPSDIRNSLSSGQVQPDAPTRADVLRFLSVTVEEILGRAYVLSDLGK